MIRAWRRVWPCVCGGTPELFETVYQPAEYLAGCADCGRMGPQRESKEAALRAWNHEIQILNQGIQNEERASKERNFLH